MGGAGKRKDKNELTKPYPMTDAAQAKKSRDRIIIEATVMFAKKGYAAVSMRDIAEKVDMKAASLYSHFVNKEGLWDAILKNVKDLYLIYFERLSAAIELAASFAEVLDCMFAELRQVVNIFTYYGISLVHMEQNRDKKAYEIYREVFIKHSVEYIGERFDECIENGWAKSFDTKTAATIFMHSVMSGINMRVHEDMGEALPYDVRQMFESLYRFIYYAGALEETEGSGR